MSINAIIDGTTYEGIQTIIVGGKTITLNEVEDSGDDPITYPTISFYKGGNIKVSSSGLIMSQADNRRAFAYLTEAVNGAIRYTSSVSGFPSSAYPLYIPEGATKVTVACANNLMCAINAHKDLNGTVTPIDSGNWSALGGESDYDLSAFIAQGATHISVGFGTSNTGSLDNITVDDTTVQISFS